MAKFSEAFTALKRRRPRTFSADIEAQHQRLAMLFFTARKARQDYNTILYTGKEVAKQDAKMAQAGFKEYGNRLLRFARRVIVETRDTKRAQDGFPALQVVHSAIIENPKHGEEIFRVAKKALKNGQHVNGVIFQVRKALRSGNQPEKVIRTALKAVRSEKHADDYLAGKFTPKK